MAARLAVAAAAGPPAAASDGGGNGGDGGGSIWAMTWWGGSPEGPGPFLGGPASGAQQCAWQDAGGSLASLDALLAGAGLPPSFWTVPRGGGHHGIWGVNLWAVAAMAGGAAGDHFDLVACPDAAAVPPSSPAVESSLPTVRSPSGAASHLWLFFDTVPDPPAGHLPPLIGEAWADARLPVPAVRSSPDRIDLVADATLVHFPTWLWIDPSAWHRVVATASGGGYVATVWADPVGLEWRAGWSLASPGEDPEGGTTLAPEALVLDCAGPGAAYGAARPPADGSPPCVATFGESTFGTAQALRASIDWQVHWALSDAAGVVGGEGTLRDATTTGVRPLRVLQVESVVTAGR